jgi:putative transposase
MMVWLRNQGYEVNRKRVQRLMQRMGVEAIYPKRRLSQPAAEHRIYPYRLRDVRIRRPDQVWSSDITYVRLRQGFVYLVAVMDWFSRYVLSWEISVTLESSFCVSALEWALNQGCPEIFNTDQGAQFTSQDFIKPLENRGIVISMDGRGRALDNVFVERLWRAVKYEEIYLKEYEHVPAAVDGIRSYFRFYNHERPHQSLEYQTPAALYFRKAQTRRRSTKRAMV